MEMVTSERGKADGTRSNYAWLENFWRDCIRPRRGRRWEVATLIDGDVALRDGYAHSLIRGCLRDRSDVDFRYIRAWSVYDDPDPLPPNVDVLFVGRPKPFAASRLGVLARRLEGKNMYGRFIDPNTGQTGNSVGYGPPRGGRFFTQHELEEPFGRYCRCDRDYGILMLRREGVGEDTRTLVAIAGLGALGTLLLTVILTDDTRRRRLIEQAGALAPLGRHHLPRQGIEICVRVQVPDEEQLTTLLNGLSSGAPAFDFRVDAVAVAMEDGKRDVRIRAARSTHVELQTGDASGRGGHVRLAHTGQPVALSARRFALLRRLVEAPDQATKDALCRHLGLMKKRRGGRAQPNYATLQKLVFDLNKNLKKDHAVGERNLRLVYFDRKKGRYVLDGAAVPEGR